MSAWSVSLVFSAAVIAWLATQLWLTTRQMRHVAAHRDAVPEAFRGTVTLEAHRKAADYTLAKGQFGMVQAALGAAVLLGWTLLGGLDALNAWVTSTALPVLGPLGSQLALLAAFVLLSSLIDLPSEWYATFRLEQRFGFNRTTPRLWVADLLKGLAVGAVLGLPLAALVLWLMDAAGPAWWLWAWAAWAGFNLLLLVIYPTVIAPLFNRFEPLKDESLAQRVQALMQRCGFAAKGLFVMDGSRRSAHANAYFTGLGSAKRVVFYDTLLARLTPGEVEAVLAHELGHFRHRHVPKRIVTIFALSLVALAFLGWLSVQGAFYVGLGVEPLLDAPRDALALLLFSLALPPFAFFLSPIASALSRRHEYEADAYACAQADGRDLASALLKLHEDNAATLTPDPVYVRFHYSHPRRLSAWLRCRRQRLRPPEARITMQDLLDQRCRPVQGQPPMPAAEAQTMLGHVAGWSVVDGALQRQFRFADYHRTMAFVNAVAWIAHSEDHHPDLTVRWGDCTVRFSTHSVGGLSINDFICAAKVNALGA